MQELDAYDYIDKLELADKILAASSLISWLTSILSATNFQEYWPIWFISIYIPIAFFSSNKVSNLLITTLCAIVYLIVSIIITRSFQYFIPHIVCYVFCAAGSLLGKSRSKVEKCYYDLKEKTRDSGFHGYIANKKEDQNKMYRQKAVELSMMVYDKEEISKEEYEKIKEKIEELSMVEFL